MLMKEETFGLAAPLIRFSSDAEVGLACYFYSRDIGRLWRVAEAFEYGIDDDLEVKYMRKGGL